MYMLNKDGVLINTISYEEDQEKIHRSRESRARKEGEISGLAKGENKAAKEIAINMLKDNIPLETIMKYTSLSEKEILKLKK